MKRIGVISDTHGLMRPEALVALTNSDVILHAGDIGSSAILDALRGIAPVHVVRGNNDKQAWARDIPETASLTVSGCSFYMLHDVKDLDFEPAARAIDVVVAGHSHRPRNERLGRVLYFNPGSAGPRRFQLPITVGCIVVSKGAVQSEIIELPIAVSTKKRTSPARR